MFEAVCQDEAEWCFCSLDRKEPLQLALAVLFTAVSYVGLRGIHVKSLAIRLYSAA